MKCTRKRPSRSFLGKGVDFTAVRVVHPPPALPRCMRGVSREELAQFYSVCRTFDSVLHEHE